MIDASITPLGDQHGGLSTIRVTAVSMGNPHVVTFDVHGASRFPLGPLLQNDHRFPQRANVGFGEMKGAARMELHVYERGAGWTEACGTGACAAAVAGISNGWLQSPVTVHTQGGDLVITWPGQDLPVMMSGPATTVFEGELEIDGH
jgi:diaminopimelate epimerase